MYWARKSKSFILGSLSCVRVFVKEKKELIETLAKSQEEILNCVDSKLHDLKRSIIEDQEDCLQSVVKKGSVGRKLAARSSLSLTIPWKPNSIQPLLSLTRRSWIERSKSYRKGRNFWLSVRNWLNLPTDRRAAGPLFQRMWMIVCSRYSRRWEATMKATNSRSRARSFKSNNNKSFHTLF